MSSRPGLWPLRLLLAWLLALGCWVAQAAQPAPDVARLPPEGLILTPHLSVLEDPSGTLTLADVQRPDLAARFAASGRGGEALSFSYTRHAVWVRMSLRNGGDQPAERLIEVSYALLAQVDFSQPDGQGGYRTIQTGYTRPLSARPVRSSFFVLPFVIPAGSEQVFFLRVQTPNSLILPIRLWEPAAFSAHEHQRYFLQALYFGIVIAIGLYNLMLFFALRDASYGLYVAFALSLALALAAFTGIGAEFLWPEWPLWSKVGVNVPASAAAVAMLLFARRMLNTAVNLPRIDRLLLAFAAGHAVFIGLNLLWFQSVAPVWVAFSAITSTLLLATGLLSAWRRERGAYYFVAAFSVLLCATVLAQLRNLGILPSNLITESGTQIGSTLDMLLLSFALADRYNALRRDKVAAQAQTLAGQRRLIDALKVSESRLERRVSERTEELEELNRRLEAMSTTDALTAISNRRHFDAVLETEWMRAARAAQPLALGIVDVDHFKRYNDQYGHPAGDEALRQVAATLRACVARTGDLVARYGGEEFAFIAPGTDGAAALKIAKRICEALKERGLLHAGSDTEVLTCSVGVASWVPDPKTSAASMLSAADAALYRAKDLGRNQAVLAAAESDQR